MIVVGNLVGFLFAALVFVLTVVSFQLILDREATAEQAIRASFEAVRSNPVTTAAWARPS